MYKVNKTALVLEGGGFRGMYTSGVLDAFLKKDVHFPYVIGVSAGAAYGISYASRQYGRNKDINLKYTSDPRYMSWGNLFRKGNLFDWDFVYGEIPEKLDPFDFEAFYQSAPNFNVGVTNAFSGEAEFFSANNMERQQLLLAITASSSLPFVSQMAHFNNGIYMDGGLADSIPVLKAFDDGQERAVVVLTRNENYRKKAPKFQWLIKLAYRKYPKLAEAILTRAERYNQTLDLLEQMEKDGRVFIIRPQKPMRVSRIENDAQKLDVLYQQGYDEMMDQINDLGVWLG
ncbi:MAG: patatin family protein [Carboxylicivirga sp.]|jgi:predicted patatin/cPLA2 family phospholipase|nr:patatin family protein [Carboxylicivirga sp.]